MIQLAIVTNRDGTEDLVDVLTRESNGNYYVFHYPPKPYREDNGRSVRSGYIRLTARHPLYLRMALWFSNRFPAWVTI